MERLTHERVNGIKTGYWSPAKKDNLIQRLGRYEDTGLEPEDAGLKGSPTYVNKAFRAPQKDVECVYTDSCAELADAIKCCGGLNE